MLQLFSLIFFSVFSLSASATTSLNVEVGQATAAYNKVQIDGEDGTRFNLAPALDPMIYHRLSLSQNFKSRHGFRLLYAPLKFTGKKRFSKDIDFNGVNFPSSQETKTEYQFNSYRGTYFYELVNRKDLLFRIGGTLKVRDAYIQLEQADRKKFKKNTGIVPLFYAYSQKTWDRFILTLDFDGLMAPQGRAFDVALMAGYKLLPGVGLHVGYRMLEGGADNKNVYNFSQINYLASALQVDF
jgi:hypothetical protein